MTSKPSSGEARFALGLLALFLGLAALGYAPVLSDPNAVLAFNDGNIETALSPTYRFPGALLRLWDNQFFFGSGAGQHPVSFQGLGESLFGPHHYRRLFPAVILALTGMAVYGALRLLRLSRLASAFGAGVAMLSAPAYHFAMVGLPVRPVAMGFAFLAVGLAARGQRTGDWAAYALSGGCLGLAVSEVADVGALYAITAAGLIGWMHLAAVRSRRDALRAAARLAILPATAILLAWQTVGLMVRTQVAGVSQGAGDSDAAARYEWATQWSLPKAESWSIVSGTYFGAGMSSEKAPYWGRVGRSQGWTPGSDGFRNFTLTGWGLGAVGSLLLLACAAARLAALRRKEGGFRDPMATGALLFAALALMLSWGKYFPLYRALYALPFFSTIRNPEKWNGPFVLCAVLAASFLLDRFLEAVRSGNRRELAEFRRAFAVATGLLAAIAAGVLLYTLGAQGVLLERLTAEGYGPGADAAVRHSVAVSWKTLFLLLAAGAAGLGAARAADRGKGGSAPGLAVFLFILAAGDLLFSDALFAQSRAYRPLLKPNPLTSALEQAGPDRRLALVPPRDPVLNNLRLTLLQISGGDLFTPVSVSRMPEDYDRFFRVLERDPLRLWEIGSVRFLLGYAGLAESLRAGDGGRNRFVERAAFGMVPIEGLYVPTLSVPPGHRVFRLIEFTGAQPKYRWVPEAIPAGATAQDEQAVLEALANPAFDLSARAFVHGSVPALAPVRGTDGIRVVSEAPASAVLETRLDAPALCVRAVKYDPDWIVTSNGKRLELLRVNSLFQGAVIPSGSNRVEWRYRPDRFPLIAAMAGRVLFLLGAGLWLARGRREAAS